MDKRIIPCGNKYESKIYVIDEIKEIYKLECLCWNFKNKRIFKHGKVADTKFFSTPCKHLSPFVLRLENIGYTLRQPSSMEGPNVLPIALRKKLLKRANNRCEAIRNNHRCPNKTELQVHRKLSGVNGGKYIESNCKILCRTCHELITPQPWQ